MAPVGEGLGGVGDDQVGVDLELGAQPVAGRAGPVGRVEREVAGRGLLEGEPAERARQVLGERDELLGAVLADDADLGDAVGEPQGGLHRLGQALADVVAPHQPVDDDLDGVLLVAGQVVRAPFGQLDHLAVDPGPGEPLLGQVVEQRLVLALAAPHHRGEHLEARPLGQVEDAVHDLLGGLAGHGAPAVGAVGMADPGVEQPEVVVDLGDRPHRRPRVAPGGLLVDRDGRRQPLDEVDVGLVHLPEELPGVGRQRLDVAALALGVDGVEGERRLARPRQAR